MESLEHWVKRERLGEAGSPAATRPVALITGATRPGRVGPAIARRLAAAGCHVIVTCRDQRTDNAIITDAALPPASGVVRLALDDLGAVDRAAADLARVLPRLDVLVHNASLYEPTPLATLSAEQLDRFFRVNAVAPLLLSRGLAPMLARSALPGGASIVALADIHALGENGQPRRDFYAYGLSKAALVEAVLILARELAPRVRVNAVAPGVVAFPTSGHESDDAAQARYLTRVPLARAGTPDDAAAAVRWLALEARYTTGQVLRVDGGRWIT